MPLYVHGACGPCVDVVIGPRGREEEGESKLVRIMVLLEACSHTRGRRGCESEPFTAEVEGW